MSCLYIVPIQSSQQNGKSPKQSNYFIKLLVDDKERERPLLVKSKLVKLVKTVISPCMQQLERSFERKNIDDEK